MSLRLRAGGAFELDVVHETVEDTSRAVTRGRWTLEAAAWPPEEHEGAQPTGSVVCLRADEVPAPTGGETPGEVVAREAARGLQLAVLRREQGDRRWLAVALMGGLLE